MRMGFVPAHDRSKKGQHAPRDRAGAPDARLYIANFIAVGTCLPAGERIDPNLFHLNGTGRAATPSALAVDGNSGFRLFPETLHAILPDIR
jgi:hypothetical protein